MNRLLTMLACMVLTVLCAAGPGQAGPGDRVAWGNSGGANNGQYSIENMVILGAGAYSGTGWECPTTCNVESVLVTIEHNGSDGASAPYTVAAYDQGYNLLDTTAEQTISPNGTAQYQIAWMNGFTATAGNLYHIACWAASQGATNLEWAYSTAAAGTDSARFDPTTYATAWPDPQNPTINFAARRMVGGFVGFEPAAEPGGISPRRRRLLSGGSQ